MRVIILGLISLLFCASAQSQTIEKKKDSYGITYEGKWVVKPKFEDIRRLSEKDDNVSCFAVKQDSKYDLLYLVKDQELGPKWKDLEFPYDDIELMTEQIARTRLGDKYGLVQVDYWKIKQLQPSKKIIDPECDEILLWSEKSGDKVKRDHNAVWFLLNGKQGLVLNIGGKLSPNYRLVVTGADDIKVFESNKDLLAVQMKDKTGLFDVYKKQKYVFPPKYQSMTEVDLGELYPDGLAGAFFIVSEYDKYGFSYIDTQDELQMLPLEFDSIIQIGKTGYFKLQKEDKEGLSNLLIDEKKFKELCRVGYDSLQLVGFEGSADKEFYISLQFDGLKGFARVIPEEGGVFELMSIPEFEEIHSFRKTKSGAISYVVGKGGSYGYRYFMNDDVKWEVEPQYREIISLVHNDIELFLCIKKNSIEVNPHQKRSRLFLSPYKEVSHRALAYHDTAAGLLESYYRIDFYNHLNQKLKALEDYRIHTDTAVFDIGIGIPGEVLSCCLESKNVSLELGGKQIDLKKILDELIIGPRFKNNLKSYEDNTLRIHEWSEYEDNVGLASYYFKSDTLQSKTFGALVDTYIYEENKKIRNRKELSGDKKKEFKVSLEYDENGNLIEVLEDFNETAVNKVEFGYDTTGIVGISSSQKAAGSKKFTGSGIWEIKRDSSRNIKELIYFNNEGQSLKTKRSELPKQIYQLYWANDKITNMTCLNAEGEACEYGSQFKIERNKKGRFEALVILGPEEGQVRRVSDPHVIEALPIGGFILPFVIKADHF